MRVASLTPAGTDILEAIGGLGLLDTSGHAADADVVLLGEPQAARFGPSATVVFVHPRSIEDVLDDIVRVGEACGLAAAADRVMVALRARYCDAQNAVNAFVDGPTVAVLTALNPLQAAGFWVPGMVVAAGGRPVGPPPGDPPRVMTPDQLAQARPDRLVVATAEATAAAQIEAIRKTPWWSRLPAVKQGRVAVRGGGAFTRPGPRLIEDFEWLAAWLNR
ncbi:MAG: ABC transporter substrate-binding protein [Phycisphaerales bacterium]|jgi:iron complex transport system substrate-binding protein|nr:ABC transporter substrate-binding protein [Phycisphaerales bacterium]